jgi:hypothetical protein
MTRSHARDVPEIVIEVDGRQLRVLATDTIGSGLLRAGRLTIRGSKRGEPRGIYCAIGVCNECLVTVDDVPNVRACVTRVKPGLRVTSQGMVRELQPPG